MNTYLSISTHRKLTKVIFTDFYEDILIRTASQTTLFIVDKFFEDIVDFPRSSVVLYIESSEFAKDFSVLNDYYLRIQSLFVSSPSVIVALGGGVIQDISSFLAGTRRLGFFASGDLRTASGRSSPRPQVGSS